MGERVIFEVMISEDTVMISRDAAFCLPESTFIVSIFSRLVGVLAAAFAANVTLPNSFSLGVWAQLL